jgi:hypothetical protein
MALPLLCFVRTQHQLVICKCEVVLHLQKAIFNQSLMIDGHGVLLELKISEENRSA